MLNKACHLACIELLKFFFVCLFFFFFFFFQKSCSTITSIIFRNWIGKVVRGFFFFLFLCGERGLSWFCFYLFILKVIQLFLFLLVIRSSEASDSGSRQIKDAHSPFERQIFAFSKQNFLKIEIEIMNPSLI